LSRGLPPRREYSSHFEPAQLLKLLDTLEFALGRVGYKKILKKIEQGTAAEEVTAQAQWGVKSLLPVYRTRRNGRERT